MKLLLGFLGLERLMDGFEVGGEAIVDGKIDGEE